jgi:hypothetical protein
MPFGATNALLGAAYTPCDVAEKADGRAACLLIALLPFVGGVSLSLLRQQGGALVTRGGLLF